jgi:hypothetical protein
MRYKRHGNHGRHGQNYFRFRLWPKIFSNNPKNLFKNFQNPEPLTCGFRVIRAVRVALFVRAFGAHCRQGCLRSRAAPPFFDLLDFPDFLDFPPPVP